VDLSDAVVIDRMIADEDAEPMAQPDLSRLSAEELALFEKLLLKITGAFEGDPPFRVEFINRNTSEANAADAN
jgi:hypothetical protein